MQGVMDHCITQYQAVYDTVMDEARVVAMVTALGLGLTKLRAAGRL